MILGGHPKTLMEEDEIPPDFELYQDRLRQYQKRAKPVLFMIEDTESRLEEERLRYLLRKVVCCLVISLL